MSNIITKKSKNVDKKTLLNNLILAAKEYKKTLSEMCLCMSSIIDILKLILK